MVFSANPLSLSVPDPAFESWLRDTGYLEVLDSRSSSTDTCPPSTSTSTSASSASTSKPPNPKTILSSLKTLISLLTLNPFAKLTPDDFAGPTPSWTLSFIGRLDSYTWPAGPAQARMRAQENVRRYARNYAFLSLLFLACSLYQMPVPLLGVVASLMMWEGVRFCSERWAMEERCPGLRQVLVRVAQIATAVILYLCNLQIAFFCAISVSYTAICWTKSPQMITAKVNTIGYQVTTAIIFEAGDGCGSRCCSRLLDVNSLLFCWHVRSQAPDSLFTIDG